MLLLRPVPLPTWSLPKRYVLQGKQPLGRGVSGDVWEAADEVKGGSVAVKRVSRIFENLVEAKRMLREVAILKRLDSEHIVRLYDVCLPVGSSPGNFSELFLIFERCDGDLRQMMERGHALEERQVLSMARDILMGLNCLHQAGVLHRDLKPSNCLLRGDMVCLADLGLSRPVSQGGERIVPEVALPDVVPEPPRLVRQLSKHVVARFYRAPEVMLPGEQHYTAAIDVWAAGCIIAELLQLAPNGGPSVPLFPGTGSLNSPRNFESVPETDMLVVILRILGPPTDLKSFSSDARAIIKEACTTLKEEHARQRSSSDGVLECSRVSAPTAPGKEGLAGFVPDASSAAVDLLRGMITFDASQRPSAEAALAHHVFASLQQLPKAMTTPRRIEVDFEVSDTELLQQVRRQALMEELRTRLASEIGANNGQDPAESDAVCGLAVV